MMTREYKKFSKEEIDEIKRWGNSHVLSILRHLGIEHEDRGKYLTTRCPIPYHPGDRNNPRAFVWSFDKNTWRCYSHGCQEDTSSDIVGLVMSMKEMAFPQALNLLNELKSGELKNDTPIINSDRPSKDTDNTPLDKAKLSILMPDTYFAGRGIRDDILRKHNVGYWQKTGTFMDRRAIVPVFDLNNNLVGYTGRVVGELDNTDQAKWVHGRDFVTRKAGTFNKQSVLYNLNNCRDVILKTKKIFIVEGPIDVWKMEMAGITNVVATLGLGLSFEQQKLLVSLGVEVVVLCYDNDEHDAGGLAANRIKEQIGNMFKVEIKIPKNNHDYGDMSVAQILETLLNE